MAAGRTPLKQIAMPFAEGEASHAERWNDLGIALLRIPPKQCTAQLAGLVRWIFNVTKGGVDGALTKSFAELAQRPWGLCCDERTVRRTVDNARRYRLITVEGQRRYDGSQQCNAYRIDWAGIGALKNGFPTDGHGVQGGGHKVHPHGHTDHPGGHGVRHIKEFSLPQSSTVKNSGPVPGAAPNPNFLDNDSGGTDAAAADRDADDSHAGIGGDEERGLSALLCRQSSLLAEARERRLAPLPADELSHGIYAPIESKHLRKPLSLVAWHRKQLSTVRHPMGDTEADLLMTIAAALYAVSIPDVDVRKTRVAIFVNTIHRRKWCRALPFVPKARALLDAAIENFGPEWHDRLTAVWDQLQAKKTETPNTTTDGPPTQPPPRRVQPQLSETELKKRLLESRRKLEEEWRQLESEKVGATNG